MRVVGRIAIWIDWHSLGDYWGPEDDRSGERRSCQYSPKASHGVVHALAAAKPPATTPPPAAPPLPT